jgi:hypothetical protein
LLQVKALFPQRLKLVSVLFHQSKQLDMHMTTTRPETPYEAASYDLNQFRERRMNERRATPRGTADRRGTRRENDAMQPPTSQADNAQNDLH